MLRAAAIALSLVAAAPAVAIDPTGPAPRSPPAAIEPAGLASAAALEPVLAPSTTGDAPEPAPVTTTARPPLRVETSQQPGETGWLDVGHAYVERRIFEPLLWVDRFFADQRDTEPERSRSFVRVRQEVNFTQFRREPGYGINFSASLRFPSLDQRLDRFRLEVAGEARDAFTALIQGDRTAQGELVTSPDQRYGTADAGVGYRLWETLHTHGDVGVGLMLQLPPGAYARARLRFVEPLGREFLARQAITGFWRTDTLFGSTGSAELERPIPFAYGALWRLSGTTTITQRSRGFEWAGDLSLIATLVLQIGGQVGVGLAGATAAPVDVDVYHVYLRLRRDVFRKWVFVEIAPEYQWPWTEVVGHRIGYWDVAFRVEVQFQGSQAAPERREREPEPADPPVQPSLPPAPSSR